MRTLSQAAVRTKQREEAEMRMVGRVQRRAERDRADGDFKIERVKAYEHKLLRANPEMDDRLRHQQGKEQQRLSTSDSARKDWGGSSVYEAYTLGQDSGHELIGLASGRLQSLSEIRRTGIIRNHLPSSEGNFHSSSLSAAGRRGARRTFAWFKAGTQAASDDFVVHPGAGEQT